MSEEKPDKTTEAPENKESGGGVPPAKVRKKSAPGASGAQKKKAATKKTQGKGSAKAGADANPAAKPSKSKSAKTAKKASSTRKKSQSTRRKRSDSTAAAVEFVQAATREIEPPAHVRFRKRDYPFFDSVIAEFAKVEWTDHTIELAALLARAISDLEMEQDMMRREGAILEKYQMVPVPNTDPVEMKKEVTGTYINPRKQLIDMHSKNILAWRRSLSLHARVKDGEPRDQAKRRTAAKEMENKVADFGDKMNLIARPEAIQ